MGTGVCKGLCPRFGLINDSTNRNNPYRGTIRQMQDHVPSKKCRACKILFPTSISGRCPCCNGPLAIRTKHPSKTNRRKRTDSYARY